MTDEPYFDYGCEPHGFDRHWHDHMSPHGELHSGEDLWDMRCHPDCDDQLAVFSTVGRGLKGNGYKVRVIEGDSGETFLEGLREDSATGEYSRDWVSDNIDGGKLTYKYNLHPFTSPKTFTITFAYHKTGDDKDDWTWTTPSIPYIWGDEDINVPSIEAFDGLQEQIDALTEQNAAQADALEDLAGRVAALEAAKTELEKEIAALKRSRSDILDHIYGQRDDHSGQEGWEHRLGGDVWLGPGISAGSGAGMLAGEIYWNYDVPDSPFAHGDTLIPVGNLNVYGGYDPNASGVNAVALLRTHSPVDEGDIWARLDSNNNLTGMWQYYPRAASSTNGWLRVAELND